MAPSMKRMELAKRSLGKVLAGALCLVSGLATPTLSAVTEFSWPGWTIPGQKLEEKGALAIVPDEEAQSIRKVVGEDGQTNTEHVALIQRVSRRMMAKARSVTVAQTPRVKRASVEPGVYRVRARVRFDGEVGLIGTPIHLTLDNGPIRGASREYSPCDFDEAGPYYELDMLYEFSPAGDKRLPARATRHTARPGAWYYEVYPDAERPTPTEPPKDKGEFSIAISLPQTKYSSFSGMPPNSLRSVSVDWIKMEKVDPSPSITVRHVRPQKVWLRPGQPTAFAVSLENFTTQRQERVLQVSLTRGFDDQTVLDSRTVALAAGEARVIDIDWSTTEATPLWGYTVRADILNGETVDSSAHDMFSVHPECYAVHVMGSRTRHVDPFRHPETYQNHVEVFGVTPGDCAKIMPDHDAWIMGMLGAGGIQTFRLINAMVEHNQKEGIASFMYLFAGGTGTPLMDLYVEHPEWMANRVTATDILYRMRREREEYAWNHDFDATMPLWHTNTPHIEQHLNHCFPELKQRIEEEALAFVERTGFEGIRFDVGIFSPKGNRTILGTPNDFDMSHAHEQAATNFVDFARRLREEHPGFEFGANMDSWAYLEQVGNRETTPKPPDEYPEFIAFCQAHGMLMDEGTMNAPLFDNYMNRWEDALWGMCQKRNVAARYGGTYEAFSPHRNGAGHFAHDDIYWAVVMTASGSHYVGNYSAPPYSDASVGEFVTRFSEFFWDTDLAPLEDAEDLVYIDAPADVWFADAARSRELGGRLRYVLPLINPPVVERLRRNKANELPTPIREPFNIEINLPGGYAKAEAWMLTWEPRVMAQRLTADRKGDLVTVSFPALELFRTLVVEFSR